MDALQGDWWVYVDGSGAGRTASLTQIVVQGARDCKAQGFGWQATLGECQGARVRSAGACGARALMHRSVQVRISRVLNSRFPQGRKDGEGHQERPPLPAKVAG